MIYYYKKYKKMNIENQIDKEYTNVPKSVLDKLDRNLYKIPSHPLNRHKQIGIFLKI
jgi:hypothetical protein